MDQISEDLNTNWSDRQKGDNDLQNSNKSREQLPISRYVMYQLCIMYHLNYPKNLTIPPKRPGSAVGRASSYGSEGPGFESCRVRKLSSHLQNIFL